LGRHIAIEGAFVSAYGSILSPNSFAENSLFHVVGTDRQSGEYINPATVDDPSNAAPFRNLAAKALNLFLQLGRESGALLSVRFDDHLETTVAEILGDHLKSQFAGHADSMKTVQLANKCAVACSHIYSS
jgi:hypothetical protein